MTPRRTRGAARTGRLCFDAARHAARLARLTPYRSLRLRTRPRRSVDNSSLFPAPRLAARRRVGQAALPSPRAPRRPGRAPRSAAVISLQRLRAAGELPLRRTQASLRPAHASMRRPSRSRAARRLRVRPRQATRGGLAPLVWPSRGSLPASPPSVPVLWWHVSAASHAAPLASRRRAMRAKARPPSPRQAPPPPTAVATPRAPRATPSAQKPPSFTAFRQPAAHRHQLCAPCAALCSHRARGLVHMASARLRRPEPTSRAATLQQAITRLTPALRSRTLPRAGYALWLPRPYWPCARRKDVLPAVTGRLPQGGPLMPGRWPSLPAWWP